LWFLGGFWWLIFLFVDLSGCLCDHGGFLVVVGDFGRYGWFLVVFSVFGWFFVVLGFFWWFLGVSWSVLVVVGVFLVFF
jgi:hypothetical protein